MLSTVLTRALAIDHPIIQAGMSSDCGASLAAAVSNAGGLGTVGSLGRTPENLEQQLAETRASTSRPWSVNVATFDWSPFAASLLDVAIGARPDVVTLSFGNTLPAVEKCQAAGIRTLVQVQDFAGARAALAARPFGVIVQGNEAGGHTGQRGTLSFAAQVLDIAGDIPVIVAGGVANGRGLAGALAMGAAGVLMGTRFKATPEFGGPQTGHLDAQREAIVAQDGDHTIGTVAADVALGMQWPAGIISRILANRFTDEWVGREEALRAEVARQAQPFGWTSANNNRPDNMLNWAGESAGLVDEILPAPEIVRRTVAEAEAYLRRIDALLVAGGGG
jgi:nitronate monooxygenase